MEYRGFTIEPKLDFGRYGYWINGKIVKEGWVVTDGGVVNIMPGATWFETVKEAQQGIDHFILVGGNAAEFWKLCHEPEPGYLTEIGEIA